MADDQGKPVDGDDNGAMPNWVPVFPPSQHHPAVHPHSDFPGAGAPNWMTAFPTILHTVWKHTGDTRLIKRHWSALESYIGWLVLRSIQMLPNRPIMKRTHAYEYLVGSGTIASSRPFQILLQIRSDAQLLEPCHRLSFQEIGVHPLLS